MKRDEIMKLEGPELAAAVAKRLMGWKLRDWNTLWVNSDNANVCGIGWWRPHIDWNDTMRVLKTIDEMCIPVRWSNKGGNARLLWLYIGNDGCMQTSWDTVRRDICRAALLAVEGVE